MAFAQINNFKFGLDSRRSELSSLPGSLVEATDGHINQGGSFEQRFSFAKLGVTPVNAFGLELTTGGLVMFGSDVAPALPAGVSYIRCVHPTDTTQAMTAVLCSCSFTGSAWCAAQFANGDTFIYYNGAVVPASTNGRVLSAASSNLLIATQLYNFLNSTYFSTRGIFANAPVNNSGAYYIDIYSTPGVSFALLATATSIFGFVAIQLISNQSQGTAFSQANFAFQVFMGNTGTLSQVLVSIDNGATFGVSLLGVPISWAPSDTTGYATALNIAATITSSITQLPITGKANNNQITLLADSSLGATPNGYPVKLVSTGDFCLDDMVLNFSGVATLGLTSTSLLVGSLTTVFNSQTYSGGGTYVQSTLAGTYFWHKGANDVSMVVAGGSTYYADNFFTIAVTTNVTFTGVASAPVTAQLTKMIEILGSVTTATTAALFVIAMAAKIRTYTVANALKYTACASQANPKQLVVSRNEIISTNQFYPILASDVVGVAGILGSVVQSKPIIVGSYISIVQQLGVAAGNISGIVNISIVGGASPYFVSFTAVSTPALSNLFTLSLPEGNPSAISGSFGAALSTNATGNTNVSTTVQYTLTVKDAIGSSAVLIITAQMTYDGAFPSKLVSSSVTFL